MTSYEANAAMQDDVREAYKACCGAEIGADARSPHEFMQQEVIPRIKSMADKILSLYAERDALRASRPAAEAARNYAEAMEAERDYFNDSAIPYDSGLQQRLRDDIDATSAAYRAAVKQQPPPPSPCGPGLWMKCPECGTESSSGKIHEKTCPTLKPSVPGGTAGMSAEERAGAIGPLTAGGEFCAACLWTGSHAPDCTRSSSAFSVHVLPLNLAPRWDRFGVPPHLWIGGDGGSERVVGVSLLAHEVEKAEAETAGVRALLHESEQRAKFWRGAYESRRKELAKLNRKVSGLMGTLKQAATVAQERAMVLARLQRERGGVVDPWSSSDARAALEALGLDWPADSRSPREVFYAEVIPRIRVLRSDLILAQGKVTACEILHARAAADGPVPQAGRKAEEK